MLQVIFIIAQVDDKSSQILKFVGNIKWLSFLFSHGFIGGRGIQIVINC
jgi:hypothetical protein